MELREIFAEYIYPWTQLGLGQIEFCRVHDGVPPLTNEAEITLMASRSYRENSQDWVFRKYMNPSAP